MSRKIISLMLAVMLFSAASVNTAYANSKEEKAAALLAAKVKEGISKLGTGKHARVEVKLRDKTKLKGYIGEAGADGFTVVDAKTGAATTVAYPSVKQVKGNNLHIGVKIAIGFAILLAAIIILTHVGFAGATDH